MTPASHKSPRRWVKELRCGLAKQLIERGYSSKAVVEDLHFADHAHLCHEFKQVYGVAPQDVTAVFRRIQAGRNMAAEWVRLAVRAGN